MAGSLTELAAKVIAAFLLSLAAGYETLWFAWPIGWVIAAVLSVRFYFQFQKSLHKAEA